MSPLPTAEAAADVLVGSTPGRLGRNWYAREFSENSPFRWARSGAEIIIAALDSVPHTLKMLVEPGPGVGLKPFNMEFLDAGVPFSSVAIKGKQLISVPLPPAGPKIYRLGLRANGGATTSGDPRVLDFRVFSIEVERGRRDVLPPDVKLGMGWYPLESHGGASFRWVNNNAEISFANSDGREFLEFDIEPGPSASQKPLHLMISRKGDRNDKPLAELQITGRQQVEIPLPKADHLDLVLHTDAPGEKVTGESRILNFRLFEYPGV